METDADLVRRHIATLRGQAEKVGLSTDVLGRLLLGEVIELWRQERPHEDIARELVFAAENLDPETDYVFTRP